jgi:hypothetical protein
MHKSIIALLILVSIISCQEKTTQTDKITISKWLLGNWENKSKEGDLLEHWTKINDTTFNGESFFIKDKDTIHFEKITLQQKGEKLIYNAQINGQNQDKSIPFEMTGVSDKKITFGNPKHDYPQKISYSLLTKDNLTIEISGIQLGKSSSEKYTLKKTE